MNRRTERYTYSYDVWGRPLTVTHRLENLSPVVLHSYAYDAVGRLESDSRSGDADLQTSYMYLPYIGQSSVVLFILYEYSE